MQWRARMYVKFGYGGSSVIRDRQKLAGAGALRDAHEIGLDSEGQATLFLLYQKTDATHQAILADVQEKFKYSS